MKRARGPVSRGPYNFKVPRKPVRHGFLPLPFGSAREDHHLAKPSPLPAQYILRVDCEPVLSAMLLAEADDALIIGDQWTSKLDRRRNQSEDHVRKRPVGNSQTS